PCPTRRSSDLVRPDGTRVTGGHGVYVVRGKVAGKGLNHHVSDLGCGSFRGPENYFDPADHLVGFLRGAGPEPAQCLDVVQPQADRKSTRLNSSHVKTSYAVFCLK